MDFKEIVYARKIPAGRDFVLVGDIGGTNTTLAVLREHNKKAELLVSFHYQSQEITNFTLVVKEVLEHIHKKYSLGVSRACFAAAGLVSPDRLRCNLTNVNWGVNATEIQKKTDLPVVILINDFEAIGYGIGTVGKKSISTVKKGVARPKKPKVILGAGTGLGKSIMLWNSQLKRYRPLPSEGGHADAVIENKKELQLAEFIKKRNKCEKVEWEHLLSGRGIQNIYHFLLKNKTYTNTKYTHKIRKSRYDPALIAQYHHNDKRCKDTMGIFVRLYARCAKNFALETLALGGVYLAGGIAAGNLELFKHQTFKNEFCLSGTQAALLANIPVYVITDYKISLYGTAVAIQLHKKGAI